jgi:hypothetical protein
MFVFEMKIKFLWEKKKFTVGTTIRVAIPGAVNLGDDSYFAFCNVCVCIDVTYIKHGAQKKWTFF